MFFVIDSPVYHIISEILIFYLHL